MPQTKKDFRTFDSNPNLAWSGTKVESQQTNENVYEKYQLVAVPI